MLSKWKDKDDMKLILSAIRAASEIEDTEIIVKPHTRGMNFNFQCPLMFCSWRKCTFKAVN